MIGFRRSPLIALLFTTTLVACQTAAPTPEPRPATARRGAAFVPPPRTIQDVIELLSRTEGGDPGAVAEVRARAGAEPPAGAAGAQLVDFFYRRGVAARQIGRIRQAIDDLGRAAALGDSGRGVSRSEVLAALSEAELFGGSISRSVGHLKAAIAGISLATHGEAINPSDVQALIELHTLLARSQALAGDLEGAEQALRGAVEVFERLQQWKEFFPPLAFTAWEMSIAAGRATSLEARGQYAEAEALWRRAVAAVRGPGRWAKHFWVDVQLGRLVLVLLKQGLLLEAEVEARAALRDALRIDGRYSTHTAEMLRVMMRVLSEQGRFAEAEALARAAIDVYRKTGSADDSALLAQARDELAAALLAQARWQEALAEYEAIGAGLAADPLTRERYLGANLGLALALLRTGRAAEAGELLARATERNRRLFGDRHPQTAEARGLLAIALGARGERARARREFAEAAEILLSRALEVDDESATRPAREQRLSLILAAYIDLLADVHGTALEREGGIDAAAEAFRLAEIARGRGVQRALDASAARAAARTPALAALVRQEQDAQKQINALGSLLVAAVSGPPDQQDPKAVAALRAEIDARRRARQRWLEQIAREFPGYAELVSPAPATLERAQAVLRPGEAWIVTHVTPNRTLVWAVPAQGPVAFAAAPLDEATLEAAVVRLRVSLDTAAKTIDEIPPFDLETAWRLYAALLEPVRAGWQPATSLLVVAHGPLGRLPLALLPTRAGAPAPTAELRFAGYRAVPWLVRTHAITTLPSVTSLATLRALPPGDPGRRPFVGFGDPWFSEAQARRAARRAAPAMAGRGAPVELRSRPETRSAASSQLSMLPQLPETADEIRALAAAMDADPARDVFLGERANEHTVKTADLSAYRVIAFATHGLVPGDLDGLTQPALALTAPGVAQVEGDGLLTLEEILGLRLGADWVVLSACNTAAAGGAGAEAVSGLGRAFFYAGARALLVSHWPVETTATQALTTTLFRRQRAEPGLTRAEALRQAMLDLIDGPGRLEPATSVPLFSYAHPLFWAPFTLVGDAGR